MDVFKIEIVVRREIADKGSISPSLAVQLMVKILEQERTISRQNGMIRELESML
ncbi:hypothetical protein D3C81_375620 [compost metagenome]